MNEKVLLLILTGLITALFVHHYLIHGYFYDTKDFTNAIYFLLKSHEGLIVMISLLIIGSMICMVFTK